MTTFIMNLYFYFNVWHRARTMTFNLGFVILESSSERFIRQKKELNDMVDEYGDLNYPKQPHGYLRDESLPDNDIYT
jgi:hypothetical protein